MTSYFALRGRPCAHKRTRASFALTLCTVGSGHCTAIQHAKIATIASVFDSANGMLSGLTGSWRISRMTASMSVEQRDEDAVAALLDTPVV